MEHIMKLQPKFYNYMLNGSKRVELRLFDDKRKLINIGDTITFYKEPDLKESFDTLVIDLLKYDTFESLVNEFDIELLADIEYSKEELLIELSKYYTKDMQNKYGVLGILIKLK